MTSRIKKRENHLVIVKNQFEVAAWAAGQLICGIDEVGRGCLAGPVVTAAVILPADTRYRNLRDSKLMTHEERLKAYAWLTKNAWYGVGIVHHRSIDEHNIWHATLTAMKKALMHVTARCPYQPSAVVIDAMPLNLSDTSLAVPVYSFCKGESLSSSIAAASIIAKVKRDQLMTRLDVIFPGYYFAENKGYATKKHLSSLKIQPASLIHRTTFLNPKNSFLSNESESNHGEQQTIC